MTAPNPAPPIDPATPPAPPATPPAAPPAPPAPPAPAFDPSTLPPEAQEYLRKAAADAEARERVKARDEAKATAAEEAKAALTAQLAAALGLTPAQAPDPAALQSQLDAMRNTSKADKIEIALFRAASAAGANSIKLADSRSFMATVDKLDPGADDFAVKLTAAITAAVAADPSLKSGQPVVPATGDFGGGPGSPPGGAETGDAAIEAMAKRLGYGDASKKR